VGNGIWVLDVPDISGGCGALPTTNKLVIPGGKHPHWGPADIPPASAYEKKPVVVPTPQPQPGPQPKIVPPSPEPQQGLAVTVRGGKLRTALRRGLTITVQAPRAGRVTATGTVGARKVASGGAAAGKAGPAKVRLRFTKAAKRSLRRKRSVQLRIASPSARRAAGRPDRRDHRAPHPLSRLGEQAGAAGPAPEEIRGWRGTSQVTPTG
jgi:hypothetical protein